VSALYLDTSALGRILLDEPEKPAIERELLRFRRRVSSQLLHVELWRLASRNGLLDAAARLLDNLSLLVLDEATLTAATTIEPSNVATLDAIHLATAVRINEDSGLDAMLTYDLRLAEGARHHGIAVVSPT
jgi:predicted nucleic acid-binding protein